MPLHREIVDEKQGYWQWGNRTKYTFDLNDPKSEEDAKAKATLQMKAIFHSGYRPK
jgi:hypothetical protein